MEYSYNDGGRSAAGYKGTTGDCAVRAVAIATGKSYQEVYNEINDVAKTERRTKKRGSRSSARTGVYKATFKRYIEGVLGWKWTPTMFIGQGCKVHLKEDELPDGVLIVNVSKHYVAIINKVIQDLSNPSRQDTRCVYGYWTKD